MAIKFETKLTDRPFSNKSNAKRAAKQEGLEASEYSVKEIDGKFRIVMVSTVAPAAYAPRMEDEASEIADQAIEAESQEVAEESPTPILQDEASEDDSEFGTEGWEVEQAAQAEEPKNDLNAALATILQSKATLNAKSNEAKAKLLTDDPILRTACEAYQGLNDIQREQFASILGMKRGHKANGSTKVYKAAAKPAKAEIDPTLTSEAANIFGLERPRASHLAEIAAAKAGTYPEVPNLESKYYELDKKKHLGNILTLVAEKEADKLREYANEIVLHRYSGKLLRTYALLAALAVKSETAAAH